MATYTEQLAYEQPTGAVAAELLSSPPTPWATYQDLPETPRANFTDQIPYLQSPVPAYMELRVSSPTPMAPDTEELWSPPPTPRATYEDLPETPRASFTDQIPYPQSPVPAYMELRASPPTPKAPDTEELANSQPMDSTCIESGWPFSKPHLANDQFISQVAENDVCADASPISYLSDECNHCGCSDFGDDRAPPLENMESRRNERSFSKLGDLQDDLAFNSSQSVIPCSPDSPIRPQQSPGVPGTPGLCGSSCHADPGGMQSIAIAMTFQGLEALCMLQLCMIIHSTASTQQPNIGLNRRISSSSSESCSLVPSTTGITTHGIAEANGSQVTTNNMQTTSRKRKLESRLSNKDYSPSKRTKKSKRKTSRASFQLMALYLKDADLPSAQAQEWKYEWNNKSKSWTSTGAPEGFQVMSGEELYMLSKDMRFEVRPNAGWLPVYMKKYGNVFRGTDSLESDWHFTITDDIMQSMLISNVAGEGTWTR